MRWIAGYTQAELDAAQDRYDLRFPPDLVDLLRERRIERGHDWVADETNIRKMLAWPLEGILFDVEESDLWWPEWGERPGTAEERAEVVGNVVSSAPKLIPLFGHRFLPQEPFERGNPVFSVYQSDIIYYGADLADYLEREFDNSSPPIATEGIRHIRFWSDMVERAYAPAFQWRAGE